MELRELGNHELNSWDDLVKDSPQGTFFHSAEWLLSLNEVLEQKSRFVGIYEEGHLVAGCTFGSTRRGFYKIARRPFATPYSGIIFSSGIKDDIKKESVRLIVGWLKKHYNYICLTHSPRFNECNEFRNSGWSFRQKTTLTLQIEDLKRVWEGFEPEARNRIRHAERMGVRIKKEGSTREFYDIYSSLFEQQGKSLPLSEKKFDQLCNKSCSKGNGQIYYAYTEDNQLSTAALIHWGKGRAYYTLSASDMETRGTGSPSLLVWEIFRDIHPWVKVFDFVGANIPNIAEFKKKFNPWTVQYLETENYSSVASRCLYTLYKKIKNRSRK